MKQGYHTTNYATNCPDTNEAIRFPPSLHQLRTTTILRNHQDKARVSIFSDSFCCHDHPLQKQLHSTKKGAGIVSIKPCEERVTHLQGAEQRQLLLLDTQDLAKEILLSLRGGASTQPDVPRKGPRRGNNTTTGTLEGRPSLTRALQQVMASLESEEGASSRVKRRRDLRHLILANEFAGGRRVRLTTLHLLFRRVHRVHLL